MASKRSPEVWDDHGTFGFGMLFEKSGLGGGSKRSFISCTLERETAKEHLSCFSETTDLFTKVAIFSVEFKE